MLRMTYSADLKNVCGCGITVQGASKNELVEMVKVHAAQTHQMNQVPPELANKLGSAIKEW
jgi:predicted small metal-binding protein